MNRRDYDILAHAFREASLARNTAAFDGEAMRGYLARNVAEAIEHSRDNGGFNREAFLAACKVNP